MRNNEPPRTIYAEQLCLKSSQGIDLCGEIKIARLKTLPAAFLEQSQASLAFSLHFGQDGQGLCYVSGEIVTDLKMICQRCLHPMVKKVHAEILVSPVESDAQAKRLPEKYEPLLMSEGSVDFAQWIAEELLLALPFIPSHDTDCVGGLNTN